ncbi:MAG: hypothetical protein WBC13_00865 [Dokdonella sp.]
MSFGGQSTNLPVLADQLLPFLLPLLRQQTQAGASASVGQHELSGGLHVGVLADSQAPQFLKMDGSRPLTGNLSVIDGVMIDGVDISIHAGDPAAHHDPVTAGAGISLAGQQVSLASTVAGAGLSYSSGVVNVGAGTLISVAADTVALANGSQQYQVPVTGASPFSPAWTTLAGFAGNGLSFTGGQFAVGVANTGAAGLSVEADGVRLTSNSAPGAAASVLATDGNGYLSLVRLTLSDRLYAPLIATVSGSLTLSPDTDLVLSPSSNLVRLASGRALQSDNYASQATGMRVTYAGEGDFRYLYADEMHVKSFIADLEQALAGGQIISKSVAVLALDFTLPAAGATGTLRVRDLPSAPNMAVFQSGDFVGLRQFSRSAGSLTVGWAWGTVTAYADQSDGTQTWTFTRHATTPGSASGTIAADSLVLDFGVTGNGFYEVNAIDGAYGANSPYWRIVTWATHPASQTVRVQGGNLRGLFGVANEYGFYAGNGVGTGSTYLRLSSQTNEFRNLTAHWYNGATRAVTIDPTDGLSLQAGTAETITSPYAVSWYRNQAGKSDLSAWIYTFQANADDDVMRVGVGSYALSTSARLGLSANSGSGGTFIELNSGASYGNDLFLAAGNGTARVWGNGTNGFTFSPNIGITNYVVWHAGNDGSGSGLDADLLDGQHGSYYLAASSYSASDVLAKIKTVDGSGSGLDADVLDGYQAAQFALLAGATFTGALLSTSSVGYDWSELTPQNNWSNYGSPNATFGVKRFGNMVSVKGRITAGAAISANTAINSQLAAEYRPSAGRSFACMGSIGGAKAVVRVYVDSSGYIRPQDGFSSGDWLSVEFTYFTGG